MVPVRFFAQALGYEVLWDSMEGAAVILDPAALAAEVDQNFTVVNRALQRLMAEEDKTYRTDLNYTFSMSVDYEGKAMPLEVSLQAQVIQSGSALELSGTVDLTKALTAQSLELLVGSGLSAADLLELQALFSKSNSSSAAERMPTAPGAFTSSCPCLAPSAAERWRRTPGTRWT